MAEMSAMPVEGGDHLDGLRALVCRPRLMPWMWTGMRKAEVVGDPARVCTISRGVTL